MADFGISEAGILIAGSTMSWGTAAATAATLASTAVTTYAAVKQADYQQSLARADQRAASIEAQSRRDAAAYEEQRFRTRAARLIGKQNAIYGASGVDPSVGSPLLMQLDSVRQAELEALNIRRTGQIGALTADYAGSIANYRGQWSAQQSSAALAGGVLQAGTSLLGAWSRMSPGAPKTSSSAWGPYL